MWRRVLGGVAIAALLLVDHARPQENKKEQPAKPLSGYSVLIVDRFEVDPEAVKAGFMEQQAPVMQAEIVLQLVKKKIFDEVVAGGSMPPTQPDAQSQAGNDKARVILSGTVTHFEPGSQAQRYLIGFGAGAAKLKMHFTFRDAATGKEILSTDHQHKFWIGAFGGTKNAATSHTAEGMVKSIVDDIKNNR